MARLKVFSYERVCREDGKKYFVSGIRQGIFLQLFDGCDHFGIGEYAPLSGISEQSIGDVLGEIEKKSAEIFAWQKLVQEEQEKFLCENFSQGLAFMLSMARAHTLMKKNCEEKNRVIKLSALIKNQDICSAVQEAQEFIYQGFVGLKVKIGDLDLEDEIQKIKKIAKLLTASNVLRIDANQKLSPSQFNELFSALRRVKVEYFEEPCNEFVGAEFLENLAIDRAIEKEANEIGCARFVVVKPSRFFSVGKIDQLLVAAKQMDRKVIFSTCFESQFHTSFFAKKIFDYELQDQVHGLFIDHLFKNQVGNILLRAKRGCLDESQINYLLQNFDPANLPLKMEFVS